MRNPGGATRPALLAPAAVAATFAAIGWLYLVGPAHGVPGPRIADAIPLDELPHRAATPLLLYVGVWAAVGVLLGLVGRAARVDRLTAALVLALLVGLVLDASSALSIAVVRQIPAQHAFDRAAGLPAVYLAAALAGLGGALLGRARPAGGRRSTALAAAVATAGALDVVRAVLPGSHAIVGGLAPDAVVSLAAAFGVPVGVALLISARGLARRQRAAWAAATALLTLSVTLHVLHGFGDGGVLAVAVLVSLVALRGDFDRRPDPSAPRRVLARLMLTLAVVPLFGIVAIWVNRATADRPFAFGFALRETLIAPFSSGGGHLQAPFGGWFPISVVILAALGIAWTLSSALAPWRYELGQAAAERERARALVTAWGADTLAPFALRADKSYFFSVEENAFLAYRVVGGVAIVSGDPIGEQEALEALLGRFLEFARARGWKVAVLGASEETLPLYRRLGLTAIYHGDEAVLEVERFSLDGRRIRKVRQSVHRLRREGYSVRFAAPARIPAAMRTELEAIAKSWRAGEPQKGFVMTLDALFHPDDDAVFAIGCGPDGRPEGFIHFATSPAAAALSLSSMPRLRTTPNGFNEWLICETVAWARDHGYRRISLNFAPFAALFADGAELGAVQRIERRALSSLKGHFQLDNLLHFNEKFEPGWSRRYVVVECRRDLPRVGLAALAAESYLPFATRPAK